MVPSLELRSALTAGALLLAAAPALAQDGIPDPTVDDPTELPAGTYALDVSHGSVMFRVSHIGFSIFPAYFADIDATLAFDPSNPEAMSVSATIDPASIATLSDTDAYNFTDDLRGEAWFDVAQFPEITFQSTDVALTGPTTADVTGDLNLHGHTVPVTMAVTFNGGYASHPYDPGGSRIGFSATGSLSRSDFGMSFGVPEEGSQMGVGDVVEFYIETEFLRPLDNAPQ